MNRADHYAEAERLLAQAHAEDFDGYGTYLVARAQVHALLATAPRDVAEPVDLDAVNVDPWGAA
jgi:hypothetical protein